MMLSFFLSALLSALAQANTQVAAGYRIGGFVVDSVTNIPVPRAQVSISLGNDVITTTAGEDGRFVFAGLQAGKYTLNAASRGYVQEAYNQHGAFSIGIAVGDGQDSEHLVFRLHPQAIIYGRVTDDRGEAGRGVQVWLFTSDPTTSKGRRGKSVCSQMQTNDLGEYRFAHLLPGRYYLAVEARPWYAEAQLSMQTRQGDGLGGGRLRPFVSRSASDSAPILDVVYPPTFYPGVTDERSSEELILGAGDQVQANITLQAVPAAHLRLTGLPQGEGRTLSVGATQRVFGTLSLGFGTTYGQVSPGEYEVAGLPPGDVTLVLTTNKGNEWTSRTIEADASLGGALDASALQAAARVSGQVILPAGTADVRAGDVILNASAGALPGASAAIQSDGTFHFPEIQPGTYRIQVNLHSGGYFVQKASAKNANVAGREITIVSASDVDLTVTMGKGLGQLTGVVQLAEKPVAGVMVLLLPESGLEVDEDSRMDESDSDGTFRLAGILPGDYLLVAIKDGWDLDWEMLGALKPYLSAAQKLTIGANQSMKATVLAQEKTASIEKSSNNVH